MDGLVTNEPGLCLATFYADCVPLFFVDPVKKRLGSAILDGGARLERSEK